METIKDISQIIRFNEPKEKKKNTFMPSQKMDCYHYKYDA